MTSVSSAMDWYISKIQEFEKQANRLEKLSNQLALARLGIFVAGVGLGIAFWWSAPLLAVGLALSCFWIFGILVKKDIERKEEIARIHCLIDINQKETNALQLDFGDAPQGMEFFDPVHPYALDLDIFGKHSLFRLVNRAITLPGKERVAERLLKGLPLEDIVDRQQAIRELSLLVDWRQGLRATGKVRGLHDRHHARIIEGLEAGGTLPNSLWFRRFARYFPFITLFFLVVPLAGFPPGYGLSLLLLQAIIAYRFHKQVTSVYNRLSGTVAGLGTYAGMLREIENQEFNAPLLVRLQSRLSAGQYKASVAVKFLSRIVEKLDYRYNILVYLPLNILLFWDLRQVYRFLDWRERHVEEAKDWFEVMAVFEELSSFANLAYNNPGWIYPSIVDEFFVLEAEEMGHPLIPAGTRVTNSTRLSPKGAIMLVTGSNMAGKSTYLRTIGVNIVLALAGSPVCARVFKISPCLPFTSMRVADSLEEQASSFYAELKRLKAMLETLEKEPRVLFLLDEILRGTNSEDRATGSRALVRQLAGISATGILATHDLSLTSLEEDYPGIVSNYHFDVQVSGEELYFDYKLKPGKCTSRNASLLMRKMGLQV